MSVLGKEFSLFRRDVLKDLRRNSVSVASNLDLSEQLYKSILAQSHMLPLSTYTQPVLCSYDYTMRLFKLPHYLIIADSLCSAFHKGLEQRGDGVSTKNILNPGNFSKNGSFAVIRLHSYEVSFYKV